MSRKLALVLPGGGYTPLGPVIHFPVLALEQLGYEVRAVSYPDFPLSVDPFPWDDFSALTTHATRAAVGEEPWEDTVVVAKSLGTGILARVGDRLGLPRPRAIWLTPLFWDEAVRKGAATLGWPSLLVAGSADSHHDPDGFDAVSKALTAQSLLIEGADHGLEFPGDIRSTVEAMSDLVEATLAFASDEA